MNTQNKKISVYNQLKNKGWRNSRIIVAMLSLAGLPLTGCGLINHAKVDNKQAQQVSKTEKFDDSARASYAPMYSMRRHPVQLPMFEIPNNPEVNRELHKIVGREKRSMERTLRKRKEFYRVLDEILIDEGVPKELLALAIVESGLNQNARSHVGAVGMWQFMKITAKEYDLRVDAFEDERKDPVLSTIAAARMLQRMYKDLGSWELALAAYNLGINGVKRQIASAGGERDFWKLSRMGKFCKETRNFVPRVMAIAAILQNPNKYGFRD